MQQKESAIRSLVGARRRSRLAFAALASISWRRGFGLHPPLGARIQLDLILLPHDSREMTRSANRFHRSGCRLPSAHMKEAGDAPGLQFGDPFADQDWIMSSTVRRTVSLVSGSSPERDSCLRRGCDRRSWLRGRRPGHGPCVDRQQRIRCWCRRYRHPRSWCRRRSRPPRRAPLGRRRFDCAWKSAATECEFDDCGTFSIKRFVLASMTPSTGVCWFAAGQGVPGLVQSRRRRHSSADRPC